MEPCYIFMLSIKALLVFDEIVFRPLAKFVLLHDIIVDVFDVFALVTKIYLAWHAYGPFSGIHYQILGWSEKIRELITFEKWEKHINMLRIDTINIKN